jgi:hypothetical protein
MGLIHSRASKKRAKAEAKLANEQRRGLKDERRARAEEQAAERAGDSAWRQPTLGRALGKAAENRRKRQEPEG